MKIKVPFAYSAMACGKYDRLFWVEAGIEFEPREVSADEAPVVAVHPGLQVVRRAPNDVPRQIDSESAAEIFRLHPDMAPRVRVFGGEFYEPILVVRGGVPTRPASGGEIVEGLAANARVMALLAANGEKMLKEATTRAKFTSSDRDRSHADVRALAESVLSVDGILHRRCPEPVFILGIGGAPVIAGIGSTHHSYVAFRLDEVEHFVRGARAVGVEEDAVLSLGNRVTMVDADAAYLGERAAHDVRDLNRELLRGAVEFVSNALADRLHLHDLEAVLAYDDLREAAEPLRYCKDCDVEALLAAGERAARAAESSPTVADGRRAAAFFRVCVDLFNDRCEKYGLAESPLPPPMSW